MMKKLLVFVLVFAMVSAANAALTLKIVDNSNGTFGIKSTTAYVAGDDLYFCVISDGPTYPSGGAKTAAAPAATAVLWPNTGPGTDVGTVAILPAGWNGMGGYVGDPLGVGVPAGLYLDGITAPIGETVKMYFVNPDDGSLGTLYDTVTLIPEPASMLLLGLGGLLLRRRK